MSDLDREELSGSRPEQPPSDKGGISRRSLVVGGIGAVALVVLGGAARATAGEIAPIRPPGIIDADHFIATCIRCDRCRTVCPKDIVVTCGLEDGIINMRTPKLDFYGDSKSYRRPEGKDQEAIKADPYPNLLVAAGKGYCNFCHLCIDNCPTGALQAFDPNTQWLGEAVIDPYLCIAYEKLGGCEKCADYCPFGAITIDENRLPVVDPSKCNGCGVCVNICPSSTYRTYKGSKKRGINIESTGQDRPS
ncbi:MAG: 4Fe-4S dicluster domain-containing protein [Coriobacteriaceae bacterium]|nr:4Fe-4S dicluster domain-containing protein [Coriobacteriaceae bacterium]